nr:MAG TPA: hypothetical protein [Caudoviricetes sp.]
MEFCQVTSSDRKPNNRPTYTNSIIKRLTTLWYIPTKWYSQKGK